METGEEMTLQPAQLRQDYEAAMRSFNDRFRQGCREYNIDFVELDTTQPYDTALLSYLNKRKRLH
jgi:hypothetical protein